MSAGWHFKRSDDRLAPWFSTGVDGARQSSRADHANRCSLHHIDHSPSTQKASGTLRLDQDAERRAAIGRAQPQPSAINRHRR